MSNRIKKMSCSLRRGEPGASERKHLKVVRAIAAGSVLALAAMSSFLPGTAVAGSDLLPGKPAPEIQGQDADGAKFKLSDYRGKVVLIDFWGDW